MNENKSQSTKVGAENYYVPDCPFYVPKENMKFFKEMQKASYKGTSTTFNQYSKKS